MEETGLLSFQSIIDNYEELVKELTLELNTSKDEQHNFKIRITELINENNRLSCDLQKALKHNQKEDIAKDVYDEDKKIMENLKQQLDLTLQEKDNTLRLWKNAVSNIESLEEELKIYQAGVEGFVPKNDYLQLKLNYEEEIRKLKKNLEDAQRKLELTLKESTNNIENKKDELDRTLKNQAGAIQIIKNLEDEVLSLQNRLHDCDHTKAKLQKVIQQKEESIHKLRKKNNECIVKVNEAVNVVEAALMEKDAALLREKKLNDEFENFNEILNKIEKEAKEKIKLDTESVKNHFTEKLKAISAELRSSQEETKIKTLELDNMHQKCTLLEKEIEKLQKGNINIDESNTSKLLLLEKNLESTFQKLLLSEKNNIQLMTEKECIKNDLNQMSEVYERNLKAKEVEINTLKMKINQMVTEIDEQKISLHNSNDIISQLKNKIEFTENHNKVQKEQFERILISSRDEKIQEILEKHKSELKDLQTKLEAKDELIKKWRTETRTIVDDLQNVINDLKLEISRLKQENKKLKQKTEEDNQKLNQYKIFLDVISQDVNKISSLTVNKNIK